MAAKDVKFSGDARDRMLRGVDVLANAGTWFNPVESGSGPRPKSRSLSTVVPGLALTLT